MPKGMPIIDMKKGILANTYSIATKTPPKTTQIILPINFIIYTFIY
jgi:hypothetical protein